MYITYPYLDTLILFSISVSNYSYFGLCIWTDFFFRCEVRSYHIYFKMEEVYISITVSICLEVDLLIYVLI